MERNKNIMKKVLIFILICFLMFLISSRIFVPESKFKISGLTDIEKEELIKELDHVSVFIIKNAKIKDQAKKLFPVKSINLSHPLFSTLNVVISKKLPLFSIKIDQEQYLFYESSYYSLKALHPEDNLKNLPVIQGKINHPGSIDKNIVLQKYHKIFEEFFRLSEMIKVSSFVWREVDDLIIYTDKGLIIVGDSFNTEEKIRMLKTTLDILKTAGKKPKEIDLRFKEQVVLRGIDL